jgi:pimeloyl-ACP methyl ester carboxylesterase
LRKWLHRIDVPTLLIWGANDRHYPADYAYAYQRLIPGSNVTIIPDCGHLPQIEQRQAFVSALEGFLVNQRAAA